MRGLLIASWICSGVCSILIVNELRRLRSCGVVMVIDSYPSSGGVLYLTGSCRTGSIATNPLAFIMERIVLYNCD